MLNDAYVETKYSEVFRSYVWRPNARLVGYNIKSRKEAKQSNMLCKRIYYTTLSIVTFFLTLTSAYNRFPAGKCPPQTCVSSPYTLVPTRLFSDTMCFRIAQKECVDDPCCADLRKTLQKIAIKSYPECKRSVKQVTIDGVIKRGGVEFTNYSGFSELKITSLLWNETMGLGRILCIELQDPCATAELLCRGRSCTYSIYNPFTHECCPTCDFEGAFASPSPLPPLPPLPPPPLPLPLPPLPLPLPSQTPQVQITVRAPILDVPFVTDVLCPSLSLYFSQPCRIMSKSSTAVYYRVSVPESNYVQVKETVQRDLDNLTTRCRFLCESTIAVRNVAESVILSYRVSYKTCVRT